MQSYFLFYSIPFHSILFYPTPSHPVSSHPILPHPILFSLSADCNPLNWLHEPEFCPLKAPFGRLPQNNLQPQSILQQYPFCCLFHLFFISSITFFILNVPTRVFILFYLLNVADKFPSLIYLSCFLNSWCVCSNNYASDDVNCSVCSLSFTLIGLLRCLNQTIWKLLIVKNLENTEKYNVNNKIKTIHNFTSEK